MKAIVFDFETTGLLKHPNAKRGLQPRAIEFGAVIIDEKGNTLESYDQKFFPEQDIDSVITKITGFTNDDLVAAPLFLNCLPKIDAMFASADVMIAHNLPFDKAILQSELDRIINHDEFPWPEHKLCTVQENYPHFGFRIKLIDLYEWSLGEKFQQTHRALDDAKALAEIVIKEKYLVKFPTVKG